MKVSKQERQKRALGRLRATLHNGVTSVNPYDADARPLEEFDIARIKKEISTLESRV